MRKNYQYILAFVVILLNLIPKLAIAQNFPKYIHLNVPLYTQDSSNTCWAAASLSIIEYYKGFNASLTQALIMNYATGGKNITIDMYGCTGGTVCVQDIIAFYANVLSSGYSRALSVTEVNEDLNNDRPIVIRWAKMSNPNIGHFMIIMGCEGNGVYYIDPSQNTIQYDGYDGIVENNGYSVYWSHSLRMSSSPIPPNTGNLGTVG